MNLETIYENRSSEQQEGELNIVLLSGVHGNEYTPIYVINLIRNNIDEFIKRINKPDKIRSIKIISNINKLGLKYTCREIPNEDQIPDHGNDLNRMFNTAVYDSPEEISHKMINFLSYRNSNGWNLIVENPSGINLIIDIHSSSNCNNFFLVNNNSKERHIANFLENSNIPYYLNTSNTDTIKNYINSNIRASENAFGLTLETKGINILDKKSGEAAPDMIIDLINKFNDYQFTNDAVDDDYLISDFEFKFKNSGIFIPKYEIGANIDSPEYKLHIKHGDVIGKILSLDNIEHDVIFEHPYVKEGYLIAYPPVSYVNPGNGILIQPILKNKL